MRFSAVRTNVWNKYLWIWTPRRNKFLANVQLLQTDLRSIRIFLLLFLAHAPYVVFTFKCCENARKVKERSMLRAVSNDFLETKKFYFFYENITLSGLLYVKMHYISSIYFLLFLNILFGKFLMDWKWPIKYLLLRICCHGGFRPMR